MKNKIDYILGAIPVYYGREAVQEYYTVKKFTGGRYIILPPHKHVSKESVKINFRTFHPTIRHFYERDPDYFLNIFANWKSYQEKVISICFKCKEFSVSEDSFPTNCQRCRSVLNLGGTFKEVIFLMGASAPLQRNGIDCYFNFTSDRCKNNCPFFKTCKQIER